jgi:putative flippase GtrA
MSNFLEQHHEQWQSQFFRFFVAGCVIFGLGMLQYNLLYTLLPRMPYHASIIWCIHFLIGTAWCHAIHRRFTFKGEQHVSYLDSLFRTYLGCGSIQILGIGMIFFFCDVAGMHHLLGWSLTTILTSLLNFVVMRSYTIVAWERS